MIKAGLCTRDNAGALAEHLVTPEMTCYEVLCYVYRAPSFQWQFCSFHFNRKRTGLLFSMSNYSISVTCFCELMEYWSCWDTEQT